MLSSFTECKECLEDRQLAVLPTETVYGLAANGIERYAVEKIFKTKGRPAGNPLILHIFDITEAEKLAEVNDMARFLARRFWPGPLTIILPKKKIVPSEVSASLNTVGLRSPSNYLFRKMLDELGFPLAAPSANPTNRTSPTTALQVMKMFGQKCPPVLDGGQTSLGIESTVLDLTTANPTILRPGHISLQEIENCLSCKIELRKNFADLTDFPHKSPGNSPRHYAPKTLTRLHASIEKCIKCDLVEPDDLVLVASKKEADFFKDADCTAWYLSQTGNPSEVAHSLFRKLHEADEQAFSKIHLCLLTQKDDLALAINDRITRACGQLHKQ